MARVTTLITPGIDSVIHARIEALSKTDAEVRRPHERYPFITLSREYGCEGYSVAKALEHALNRDPKDPFPWISFDKEILARIARESGSDPGLVKLITEERLSTVGRVVIDMLSGLPNEYEIFHKMAKAMTLLAQNGRVILIGRGASVITRGLERGLHVRLIAPFESRVESIARDHNLDVAAAEREVREGQKDREAFVHKFTNCSVADPCLYHMVFNRSLCTVDEIAGTIIELMRRKKYI